MDAVRYLVRTKANRDWSHSSLRALAEERGWGSDGYRGDTGPMRKRRFDLVASCGNFAIVGDDLFQDGLKVITSK